MAAPACSRSIRLPTTARRCPATHIFTDQINSNLGTSFSAPIVSGIAALMLSRNANLSTAQMLARLREGARPFPTTVADDPTIQACHVPVNDQDFQLAQCLCTTSTCGAGMANAANSVAAAERPIAAVALPAAVVARPERLVERVGQRRRLRPDHRELCLDGGRADRSIRPPSSARTPSTATVIAPTSGSITLRVTVTDDQGRTDVADVAVEPNTRHVAAPATAGTTRLRDSGDFGPHARDARPRRRRPRPRLRPRLRARRRWWRRRFARVSPPSSC